MDNVPKSRIRLKFARLAGAAGMSHQEQIRALRELAAASGLDCWPAKPGSRTPKMAFGPALPAGYGSRCEYADLYLAQSCREDVARTKLGAVKSDAFELLSVKRVPVHFPSIEASIAAAGFLVETAVKGELSRGILEDFFAGESDARPLVFSAEPDAGAGTLRLVLSAAPGKNIRPEAALLAIAGRDVPVRSVIREELYWLDSKGRLEVI